MVIGRGIRGDVSPHDLAFWRWTLALLMAVMVWGLYTVGLHRRSNDVDPMLMLAAMMLVGVIVLEPACAWELSRGRHIALHAGSLSAIAYTAIFPGFLGYVFYNRGVAMVGPSHSALFLNLVPVFATVLSILFLDELAVLYHGIGIALILAGIWLTTRVARVTT